MLEAMAVGLVPVVVDYAGPGELVTPQTGYLVKLGTREAVVEGFRSVLSVIASDPSALDAKSSAAVRRVNVLFTWAARARQVIEVYKWVMGNRTKKPWFGMPFPDPDQVVSPPAQW